MASSYLSFKMSFKMLRMLSNCLTKICKKKIQNINTVMGVVVTSQEFKRFLRSQAEGVTTWSHGTTTII